MVRAALHRSIATSTVCCCCFWVNKQQQRRRQRRRDNKSNNNSSSPFAGGLAMLSVNTSLHCCYRTLWHSNCAVDVAVAVSIAVAVAVAVDVAVFNFSADKTVQNSNGKSFACARNDWPRPPAPVASPIPSPFWNVITKALIVIPLSAVVVVVRQFVALAN